MLGRTGSTTGDLCFLHVRAGSPWAHVRDAKGSGKAMENIPVISFSMTTLLVGHWWSEEENPWKNALPFNVLGSTDRLYSGAVGCGFLLVYENTWPHVARVCRQVLEDKGLEWAPCSSHLHSLEQLWDIMFLSIWHQQVAPQTALIHIWKEMPQDCFPIEIWYVPLWSFWAVYNCWWLSRHMQSEIGDMKSVHAVQNLLRPIKENCLRT